jgi:RNA polymerase sigma-70 factor (ECF subfamily)
VDADETLSIDCEHAIESNIIADQVLKEFRRLPETQREAVLLVYNRAGAFGIPIGTVLSRLATARSRGRI